MNVELLNSFLAKLRKLEQSFELQKKLNAVKSALNAITNAPHDVTQQAALAASLDSLEDGFALLNDNLSPREVERLDEIHATEFFTIDLTENIRRQIAGNTMSPAVVRDIVNKLIGKRQKYISAIDAIAINFVEFGIDEIELEANEAEIGFQIPRDIFKNNLDGFIKELGMLRYIINTFSEAVTGEAQEIELTQLSTSDPLIFLGIDPNIIYSIGGAVTWVTGQWLVVEKIRNLRAQTAELGGMEKIEKEFETTIEETIKKAIDEKVKEFEGDKKNPELETRLRFALHAILERVERGMTVEIRMLPPPEPDDEDEGDGQVDEDSPLSNLYDLRKTLVFPEPSKDPILKISAPPED